MDGYKKDLEEINEALEVETDKESIEILQDAKKQIEKNISDLEASMKTPKKVRAKGEPKKEKSEKKEKVEKPEKKKRSPRTYKPAPDKIKKTNMSGVDKLAVGESETDEDGNVVKRTATNTYILEYHKDPKDKVAFIKKGDKWLVDCCKKKGIEFKANEIQTAVEHIIEGLDCHYAIEERKEKAKARKKAREKYESQSDSEKIKNTIDSAAETVENRVEDIKGSGKSISKTVGKEVVADVSDIIEAISKGFKTKKDRNDFIKKLISELNKIMKSESFEKGGSVGDDAVSKIREEIENQGGLKSFSSSIRNERPVGCPMKRNIIKDLQDLKKEEIHVAFHLGLIGNENKKGSIVENAKESINFDVGEPKLIIYPGVDDAERLDIEYAFETRNREEWNNPIERYGKRFKNIDHVLTDIRLNKTSDFSSDNFKVVYE